ncbi:TPA: hypothetical protein N0F65_004024 [Lagenidium giganteum]|uniref:Temptin Cys/Cys disulfide domain-containing protein n=1 Tax=Lagenidium giganteum TaxID=4803 RepID=A0AAV2YVB7_9STRA|nr:TPA: hypothetical protein N0F65_004024 [Lagenidium giganteum]
MKSAACLVLVVVTLTVQQTVAMEKFLQELPNGDSMKKALGHDGNGGYTKFGMKFSAKRAWSKELCMDTFPGTTRTIGQAFGDPCCTWTKGGKPQFAVSFTDDFPSKSINTCPSDKSNKPSTSPSSAPYPQPAATTAAPMPGPTPAKPTMSPSVTPLPSSSAPKPTGKKCRPKKY